MRIPTLWMAALLLSGSIFGLQAAAPPIPNALTGRYLVVKSVFTIDGEPVDPGTDSPVTVTRTYLVGIDNPATIRGIVLSIQRGLRESFPDARISSSLISSKVTRVKGGFKFSRQDAIFVSIPSAKVSGPGRLVLLGSLTSPGSLRTAIVVNLTLKGPKRSANARFSYTTYYKKKGT